MLKRLELIGFKSFADRTRFDFAPGITAVVGPNGSGKSNIVDAVRWLLGEQSAKSLRGGEMTDVIFNGSSTRKSLGLAEVTMTFDNSRRELSLDSDEVQITRRVYRDGEGEYLINGQTTRLKDVKELFLGTGAGHGAYSVIEQGRVDALLSASTKDRRQIFEEAAGISRFKAKKLDTLRKLDRVDTDLIRVNDILTELDKQLRSLRLQAAKAQRYQEYTTRLRDLRVAQARTEHRSLSVGLAREEATLTELRTELAGATAAAEAGEEQQRKLDWDIARIEDTLRHQEARLADARQQIASHEATVRAERGQALGLESELLRLGKQRADLTARSRAAEVEAAHVAGDVEGVARRADAERSRAEAAEAAVAEAARRIAELARSLQADRERLFDLINRSAKLHTDAEVAQTQTQRLRAELARKHGEREHRAARHDTLDRLLAELSQTDADVRQRLAEARQAHSGHVAAQDALRHRADGLQMDLDALREERSSLRGRAEVLEGLERSLEGLGAGVRAVLHRVQAGEEPLASAILGLVADLLTAPRDVAPLIDLALGDAAQRFVVRDETALKAVLASLGEVPGRVGFVPLGGAPSETDERSASRLVQSELAALPPQLLGHVLVAADLAEARLRQAPGRRVITRAGDVLDADGAVTVGPVHADAGILSRKSELRDLRARIADLDQRIAGLDAGQAELRRQADALDPAIRARDDEIGALTGEAGSLRDQILEQRQVQKQLAEALDLLAREAALLEAELVKADAAREEADRQAGEIDREADSLKAQCEETEAAVGRAEQDRERTSRDSTLAQVSLGRVNEQLAGLRKKKDELDAEVRQRRIDAVNLATADRSTRGRLVESALLSLRSTMAAAHAYTDKEARERQVAELAARRDAARAAREQIQHELKQAREAWKEQRDRLHALELTARDFANRREALVTRIQEEFGIALTDSGTVEEAVVDPREIDDLRQKIARLGSVNLEALDELAAHEKREADLRAQFDDLTAARGKLRHIIEQINTDSRRLFGETLTAVRGHFQELFRKLFAGGTADVVLEDPNDVLESGIEITARPPGKELTRISLLSGGERALTAVALLLAIFRSRPSPFCLLDEVDAAMDEANTHRLAGLLREFSDRSQFIVVTHKKRTMAAADVLYGVTMQESGVSKLVAIRFEDWPEDSETPARRAA